MMMINCKADMLNTYVDTENAELCELFISKAISFNIQPWQGVTPNYNSPSNSAIAVDKDAELLSSSITMCANANRKQLTLADFKNTKVEYVKCEDTIFNLRKDFEDGDLYTKIHKHDFDCMVQISCSHVLSCNLYDEVAYRRVETEVTWQDEVIDMLRCINPSESSVSENLAIKKLVENNPDLMVKVAGIISNANK